MFISANSTTATWETTTEIVYPRNDVTIAEGNNTEVTTAWNDSTEVMTDSPYTTISETDTTQAAIQFDPANDYYIPQVNLNTTPWFNENKG